MEPKLEAAEIRLKRARWNLTKAQSRYTRTATIQPYIDKVAAIEKEIAELKGKERLSEKC